MNVAIVSYYAPPQAAIAAHRVLRLTRCLQRANHEVEWVTLDSARLERTDPTLPIPDATHVHGLGGPTLYGRPAARNLPEKVLRTLAHEIPRRWPFLDGHFEWRWRLRRAIPRLAVARGWDAVVICCGPHGQIGAIPPLRRARPDLTVFVDYRDLLSGNPWNESDQPRLERRRAAREHAILASADVLFLNSSDARERFMDVVHAPAGLEVDVMRNAADYALADELLAVAPPPDHGPGVHLGFFGTLFPNRRLRIVLEAMARLPADRLESLTLHCFCDAAQSPPLLDEDLLTVGDRVAARVRTHAFLPYADALRAMRAMHALVLINSPDPRDAVFVPGKLFDYLMARRPILFVGSAGDARAIVDAACGAGWSFGYDEVEELAARLAALAAQERPTEVPILPEHAPAQAFAPLLDRLAGISSRSAP